MPFFFSNTFKDNITLVVAVIDDKLLKPFMEVVHGLRVIAGGMAATSCRIPSFSCSIVPGQHAWTLAFRYPQRIKSHGVKSGDRVGQPMSPCKEIR